MLSERYVAGMLDSRGAVMIRKPATGNQSPYLVAQFGWKNREALEALQTQFGGSIYKGYRPNYWVLWMYGKSVIGLLKYARPYIRFRKPQVRIALEFGKTIGMPRTEAVRERKEELYKEAQKYGIKLRRPAQLAQ